jgi:hypothetical protein
MVKVAQVLQSLIRGDERVARFTAAALTAPPHDMQVGAVVAPSATGKTQYLRRWGSSCPYVIDGDKIPLLAALYEKMRAVHGIEWWYNQRACHEKDIFLADAVINGDLKQSILRCTRDKHHAVIILSAESIFLALPCAAAVLPTVDELCALLADRRNRGIHGQPDEPGRAGDNLSHYRDIAANLQVPVYSWDKQLEAFTSAINQIKKGLQ